MRVLISWMGQSDLIALHKDQPDLDPGPILRLLKHRDFDAVHLLHDYPAQEELREGIVCLEHFRPWIARHTKLQVEAVHLHATGSRIRNKFDLAYERMKKVVERVRRDSPLSASYALLLSPGLPAMEFSLIVAAQAIFGGSVTLYNTFDPVKRGDSGDGVEEVQLPAEIDVRVGTESLRRIQRRLSEHEPHPAFAQLLGQHPDFVQARGEAQRAAAFALPGAAIHVLLLGASGTGKDLFARAIHAASPRSGRPFLTVNCGGLAATLLESHLFGHVKDAFTGAGKAKPGLLTEANGGTLFLDEIGEMPLEFQVKLLRFLESGEVLPVGATKPVSVDVRVVAATHRDLLAAIAAGAFRDDLFYRLNGVSIQLPPLRRRYSDIRILAQRFLDDFNAAHRQAACFDEAALSRLERYSWPGNVRELKMVVQRVGIYAQGRITVQDVEHEISRARAFPDRPLQEQADREILTHLAACLDELLGRWNDDNGQLKRFCRNDPGDNLKDDLLYPLIWGRALEAGGSARGANLQLGKSATNKSDGQSNAAQKYANTLKALLDEDLVRKLREG